MSNSTVEIIVGMIEKRRDMVIEANKLSELNGSQYDWVNGIYDDIIAMIKQASI